MVSEGRDGGLGGRVKKANTVQVFSQHITLTGCAFSTVCVYVCVCVCMLMHVCVPAYMCAYL